MTQQVEAEVRGGESVEHFVNGELVMRYGDAELDPSDPDAARLLEPPGPVDVALTLRPLQRAFHQPRHPRIVGQLAAQHALGQLGEHLGGGAQHVVRQVCELGLVDEPARRERQGVAAEHGDAVDVVQQDPLGLDDAHAHPRADVGHEVRDATAQPQLRDLGRVPAPAQGAEQMHGRQAGGEREVQGVAQDVHAHVQRRGRVERAERTEEVGDVGDHEAAVRAHAVDGRRERLAGAEGRDLDGALAAEQPLGQQQTTGRHGRQRMGGVRGGVGHGGPSGGGPRTSKAHLSEIRKASVVYLSRVERWGRVSGIVCGSDPSRRPWPGQKGQMRRRFPRG